MGVLLFVNAHKQAIFGRADFRETSLDADSDAVDGRLLLPELKPPLHERNFQSIKNLALGVVRVSFGGFQRKIGWGDPTKKPVWWPGEVPWTAWGIQAGVTLQQLRRIVVAGYEHFGQSIEVTVTCIPASFV